MIGAAWETALCMVEGCREEIGCSLLAAVPSSHMLTTGTEQGAGTCHAFGSWPALFLACPTESCMSLTVCSQPGR